MAPDARAPAHTIFTPSADQTAVHHLRLMVQRVMRRSPSDVHLYVVCGEVAFPVAISAPDIPDFQPGDCLFAEYPRGDNPLNTAFIAIYPAHLRPKKETAMPALIPTSGNSLTMSSREIAELTGKRHDNVMVDIRKMLAELHGEGGVLNFQDTHRNPQNGQEYPVFLLPKRETLILVSGYSVQMRARIIDRWQELEAKAAQPAIPQTLPEALRLAADLAEKNAALESTVAEQAPKVEALDRIAASKDTLTVTQAAKLLDKKVSELTTLMHAKGWMYRQNGSWVAYQQHIQNGNLTYKEANYTDEKTGLSCIRPYCHITQKGLVKLAQMLGTNPPDCSFFPPTVNGSSPRPHA